MTRERFPQLDGLRGLAVLMVLIWHYYCCLIEAAPATFPSYLSKALGLTYSGVDLFFVLSGFLIGGIVLDNQNSPNFWRTFYARRTGRILPVYGLLLASFWAMQHASLPQPTRLWLFDQPMPLWSHLLFLQNFIMASRDSFGPHWLAVTWSLAIEEQFYLVAPLLIRLTPTKALPGLLTALIALAVFLRWRIGGLGGFVLMLTRADALLIGILCAWAIRAPTAQRWLEAREWVVAGGLVVAGIGFALMTAGVSLGVLTQLWLAFGYACLLLSLVLWPKRAWVNLSCWSPLRWLGSISYGLYLFHQPISGITHGWLRHDKPALSSGYDFLVILIALLTSLLLAWASLIYFERPILRLTHCFKY